MAKMTLENDITNTSKLIKSNVLEYHNAGLDGRDKVIVVLDEEAFIRPNNMSRDYFVAPLGEGDSPSHNTLVSQVLHVTAPKAKIVMLPFMNDENRKASMQWIRQNKVDLINMSLNLATANDIYPELKALNVPIIAAAGNKGPDTEDVASPACFDWTIAVGGYLENINALYFENSNGENMDCVAFTGIDIETKPGYIAPVSGTSAASPWLCGMLACYFTGYAVSNVYSLREFIKNNCTDLEIVGKDKMSGWGFFKLPPLTERANDKSLQQYKPDNDSSEFEDNASSGNVSADKKTKIEMEIGSKEASVNGEKVQLDCASVVQNGRTLVPLRFIAEILGCQVDYKSGKITITK